MEKLSGLFRELLKCDSSIFYFFKREFSFSVHGLQAISVAKEYYRSLSVLKTAEDGLEYLTISSALFSKLACRLLNSNVNIQVFSFNAQKWELTHWGSPGDVSGLQGVVLKDDLDSLLNTAVSATLILSENNSLHFGLAISSEFDSTVTVFDSISANKDFDRFILSLFILHLFLQQIQVATFFKSLLA